MSVYSDLDLQPSNIRSKSEKLKSDVSAFADEAMNRLEIAREKGLDLATISSRRAAELARTAGVKARAKPVTTGLIAAGIGVGLLFLFSSRARDGAASAGRTAWDRLSNLR